MSSSADTPTPTVMKIDAINEYDDYYYSYSRIVEKSKSGGLLFQNGKIIGLHLFEGESRGTSFGVTINSFIDWGVQCIQAN